MALATSYFDSLTRTNADENPTLTAVLIPEATVKEQTNTLIKSLVA